MSSGQSGIHRPCEKCRAALVEVEFHHFGALEPRLKPGEGKYLETLEEIQGTILLCGPCFREALADLVLNSGSMSFETRLSLPIHVVEIVNASRPELKG
jgi:hypothetical protein